MNNILLELWDDFDKLAQRLPLLVWRKALATFMEMFLITFTFTTLFITTFLILYFVGFIEVDVARQLLFFIGGAR